jgi:AraC-like DNA-binding protein
MVPRTRNVHPRPDTARELGCAAVHRTDPIPSWGVHGLWSPVGREDETGASSELRAPGEVLVHLRRARDYADRSYTHPLALGELAAVACLSKYHFARLFKATYGLTPMEYVSQRRIERAQDLLRATNLTVTEVCFAVGYSSLGSFSRRFRELVGETPSEFQRRYAHGAPHIPGCFIFWWGLAERHLEDSAIREKPQDPTRS